MYAEMSYGWWSGMYEKLALTPGKIYDVLEETEDAVILVNNSGKRRTYGKKWFKILDEKI